MKRLLGALAALLLLASFSAAQAQQTGALIGGGGLSIFKVIQMAAGQVMIGQAASSDPLPTTLSGDCTLTAGGVFVCTKFNGTLFGSAAAANTGTSGTALGLLNTINTYSADQIFSAHVRVGANPPTLSSCGGGSPAIVGDDRAGEVTMGTSATGCVITFATAYAAAPLCTVSWQADALGSQHYSVATTAITTVQTSTSSNKLNYHCTARNGG